MPIFEGQPQSVIYDPSIGYLTDASGNPLTIESVTLAQFIHANFNITTARHVFVSDLHSTRDASDLCGSLWWIAPGNATGYKRVLRSPPIYCATLANAPNPTSFKNIKCYIASFEGEVASDGSVYEPVDNYIVLKNITTESASTTNLETEWYPLPVEIPRDVNGNSLWRTGGYLQWSSVWWGKTEVGTVDSLKCLIRLGPTSTGGSDTAIIDQSATAQTRWTRYLELKRTGTDTVMFRGDGSTFFTHGTTTATHSNNSTIHNFDSNATYVNVGVRLTRGGGSLSATGMQIKEYELRLYRAN